MVKILIEAAKIAKIMRIFKGDYSPAMKTSILFLLLFAGALCVSGQGGYYPPPRQVIYHDGMLTIYPPDSLPGAPVTLLAYNVYVDDLFYENVPVANPEDTVDVVLDFQIIDPGEQVFCATAVYNYWISDPACDSAMVIYGHMLPFLEDWSSGNFEANQWDCQSPHWIIKADEGNPAPEARFDGSAGLANYSEILQSYAFRADSIIFGDIQFSMDVRLESNNPTGDEKLYVKCWNSETKEWIVTAIFSNENGSFVWKNKTHRLDSAFGRIIKLRFEATGSNSSDISFWSVDNIQVYRGCKSSDYLDVKINITLSCLEVHWKPPAGPFEYLLSWDKSEPATLIGTGSIAQYDIAARWTPEMLANYSGYEIIQVAIPPTEPTCEYSIRIWTDTNAANLIYEQLVENLQIGQWNYIDLDSAILIDPSMELWVGYHVNSTTGYPVACDQGPAVNGFGNMMFWEGEWQTLLDINPELNYNWSLRVYLFTEPPVIFTHDVYRQVDFVGDWSLIGTTDETVFYDFDVNNDHIYCYRVVTTWIQEGDTCIAPPSNEGCPPINLDIISHKEPDIITIYPNPASDLIHITSDREMREIVLYNYLGEAIVTRTINGNNHSLHVSHLASGLYIISIQRENGYHFQKILINR
jgi:hypothetical protein